MLITLTVPGVYYSWPSLAIRGGTKPANTRNEAVPGTDIEPASHW